MRFIFTFSLFLYIQQSYIKLVVFSFHLLHKKKMRSYFIEKKKITQEDSPIKPRYT